MPSAIDLSFTSTRHGDIITVSEFGITCAILSFFSQLVPLRPKAVTFPLIGPHCLCDFSVDWTSLSLEQKKFRLPAEKQEPVLAKERCILTTEVVPASEIRFLFS